jgi:hypothetical protein
LVKNCPILILFTLFISFSKGTTFLNKNVLRCL